jgi:hypothetical protein
MVIDSTTTDLEEVLRAVAERRPVDPEVAKRVSDRAAQVKEEIARKGITDLAVPLIRSGREE